MKINTDVLERAWGSSVGSILQLTAVVCVRTTEKDISNMDMVVQCM